MIGVRGWVFDLDGTLTVAQHDFAGIKRRLGLPADLPVLEGIAARPLDQRQGLLDAVAAWEEALADQARQSPGAHALLSALAAAGTPIGVLTRNARPTALRTLRAAGLEGFIPDDRVLGRDEAAPKPAPDGVWALARRFGVPPAELVVVGDFRFDLDAARAAGARAVWLDVDRTGAFADLADRVVHDLGALLG